VVYVKGVKKPEWCTIVRLKPRNIFAMPEGTEKENEGDIDVDSLMSVLRTWLFHAHMRS
jgi:hypothetical protein